MNNLNIPPSEPRYTGRYLVVLDQNRLNESIAEIVSLTASSSIATAADLNQDPDYAKQSDVIILDTLGVAILNRSIETEQLQSLNTASETYTSPILVVEAEQYFYALADIGINDVSQRLSTVANGVSIDYLQGYRDAINGLINNLLPEKQSTKAMLTFDETQATWGLQITNVIGSKYTGKGIKVAVLDTGFDFNHPDFIGRTLTSRSFVLKKNDKGLFEPISVQDSNGHGTHCVGTACGSLRPKTGPRYGVASGADIYIGKVLNDVGMGISGEIIAGIDWAVAQGCQVISMSLGSPKAAGTPYDKLYEAVAARVLQAGSLLVTAAGNSRQDKTGKTAINRPADSPSALAVAAIDSDRKLAPFSCASDGQAGGEIDIAAPGVDIYSSHILDSQGRPTTGYTRLRGTSMATPHVAGIAALYAEANPGVQGKALWDLLIRNAMLLPDSRADVGAGLIQAP
jgi:subtilisin